MTNTRRRYRRILRFAARVIVQTWWFELVLPRFGLAKAAANGRAARLTGVARRFHALAVDLGGLMIKVGQYMSSRLDVLPPEITSELAGLQDEVPPVPFDDLRALAEHELRMPLERAYTSFDADPLAAASLGQAHRARLSPIDAADTGLDDAVVKVQRPGIETIVDVDLAALRRIAGWLSRVRFVARRVNAPALVEEFATTSLEEIDYLHEAQNAVRFAEAFADILVETGTSVADIIVEITENAPLTAGSVEMESLAALRAMGVRIAIDDFGAGHASLHYLRDFAFDIIKIDRAYVAEFTTNPVSAMIVSAVCDIARSLSLQVVAEGIETEEQAQALRAAGCTCLQGFHLGRPQPLTRDKVICAA